MNYRTPLIIALTALLAACGHKSNPFDPRDTVQVPEGYTGEDSIAYIENALLKSPISAEDLLALAEVHSLQESLYNYDRDDEDYPTPSVSHRDSAALRLANRFMRMHNAVDEKGAALDQLAWVAAVDAILDTFRSEVPDLPADSALGEITRVMDKFSSLTQSEMNMMCYVESSVEAYRTLKDYSQWLTEVPSRLAELARDEYAAWYNLNKDRFTFWRDVSYRQEWYSMKPMEVESYYMNLMENRRAELALERGIIMGGKSYRQQGRTVTTVQWERWIEENSVPEDLDLLQDFDTTRIPTQEFVTKCVSSLKASFAHWLKARQALAAALPEEQGTSYDNLTADIHSRIVGALKPLVPLPID